MLQALLKGLSKEALEVALIGSFITPEGISWMGASQEKKAVANNFLIRLPVCQPGWVRNVSTPFNRVAKDQGVDLLESSRRRQEPGRVRPAFAAQDRLQPSRRRQEPGFTLCRQQDRPVLEGTLTTPPEARRRQHGPARDANASRPSPASPNAPECARIAGPGERTTQNP